MSVPNDAVAGDSTVENQADLAELASRYGIELIHEVPDSVLDSSLISGLPVEWARQHCLLPVRVDGVACVLTADPSSISDQDDLSLLVGEELRPVLAGRELILSSIERCYFSRQDSPDEFLRDLQAGDTAAVHVMGDADDLLQISGTAPITQLVNLILLEAVKARASDIHFEPFEARLRVRYRVDGILYEQTSPPKQMELALVSRLKVMAHMDIAERRLPQDGMARVRVGEREIDIRVSTVPVAEGERVVLRLLDRDSALLPLSELGMATGVLGSFQELLGTKSGLILVTGPTGSGKTTTLYAALQEIDSDGLNIMTIENPVEYKLPGIGQIEYKPKIGLTFSAGLRHILRQDPDVVLVGETRDMETAETAARSSMTGHLVLTTLHTNDAPSAVVRMLDMGIESYLLAASLRAALAQRLVRRLCTACRKQVAPSREVLDAMGPHAETLGNGPIWEAVGCPLCLGGYKGRVGVYELMMVDGELEDLIRRGECSVTRMQEHARDQGMSSMLSDGLRKAAEGATTFSEVLNVLGQTGVGR